MADLRQGRAFHGAAAVAGKLLVIGGKDRRGRILGSLECWDPCSGRWQTLGDTAGLTPRMAAGVAATGARLWLSGGIVQQGADLYVVSDVDYYDALANRWVQRAKLPFPCCFSGLAGLDENSLLHVGGLSLTKHRDQWAFRSRSDVLLASDLVERPLWRALRPLPEPRHGASLCCTWEDTLFLTGGLSTSRRRPPAELWSASGPGWEFTGASTLPSPLAGTLLLPLPP